MKKNLLILFTCFVTSQVLAQTPADALKYGYFTQNGTARNLATAGVMGSLGGDITANHVNPAGIGLFKTGELVLSPSFLLNKNIFDFRGTNSNSEKSNVTYGASGFIFGKPQNRFSKWTSSAFSISINQLSSFNNHIQYKGSNNFSSFSEQYLEELVKDRADTNAALSNYIFGSTLAFRTYLIDKVTGPGGVLTGYKSLVPITTGVIQERDEKTSGGLNEISLSLAGNLQDKLYVGGSINIPFSVYKSNLIFKESDATNDLNNNFNYAEFSETSSSIGIGINTKLGLIYKPKEYLRFGIAIHSPSFMSFKDEISASLTTDTEGYAGKLTESSNDLNNGNKGSREFYLSTPWRALISGSYVFREVNDTRKQKAFLSTDIEYVNYRSARYSARDANDQTLNTYYNTLNEGIKEYYKPALNFRLGGELKFNIWMIRAGFAYYGNPYKDNENLKTNRMIASTGLGYRNHGMFIDVTYSHNFNKDVNFPYRLVDKPNTFAIQNGSIGNIAMTLGFKF
jgi:hypothetical protein